jgi:hypothetical protein
LSSRNPLKNRPRSPPCCDSSDRSSCSCPTLLIANWHGWSEYLKGENRLLRDRLPKRLRITVQERRRPFKLGRPLGSALRHLFTIVTPRTFSRWLKGERRGANAKRQRKPGRPRTPEEIRDWVARMARETGVGLQQDPW